MRYSVESRVPYLDYELVEFVLSLPPEMKIRNGLTKLILRESVRDILPAKIYHRKTKLGYGTAQSQWSIQSHRGDFEQRVISAAGAIPFLDNTKVKSKLHNIDSSLTSSLFWRIIIFDIWARKFSINVN
jgi:asparagine synthase (glutamine-hydrolysing)